ncbi:unnamed protein product [Effrenium voratum]|nr:unnamed protein product [Effrenium voratum]
MVSTGLRLNPADREHGLALLGESNGRQKAQRKSGGQWVGVRATHGVANTGRWAFCVWNESGGNLRVGWSCAEASLKLGTDKWSFGYGGTATKSHSGQFTKYGQTFGQRDAITCCIDLDRRAITYMKNGRDIPGDAFNLSKDLHGWPLFPHVYTKEATFSVSFDGRGGAPPLVGGYAWISTAPKGVLVPHPKQPRPGEGMEDVDQSKSDGAAGFVLTPYGWRTADEAGVSASAQEWRGALDAYVKHFTSLLELEYEAEKEGVLDRVNKRNPNQLVADGTGICGLGADFDRDAGRITLYWEWGSVPYLSEISRGRTVLISTVDGGVDVEDASKTISGEVEAISSDCIMVVTQYERLPAGRRGGRNHLFRVDLGPNIVAYKRIDSMLDELQRCLGTFQAKRARNNVERLNQNTNLTGLLLPGTPFANALYADIAESAAAASKWDPLQRPKPNPEADISKASQEPDIGAQPYTSKGSIPDGGDSVKLNRSQEAAMRLVLERRRRFSLIQGPPGTGKTTTAVSIICGWLRTRRGPVLASAFSNRGTDNLAEVLHNLGVRVLRMGLCPQDRPYSFESRLRECGRSRGDAGLRHVLETIDVVCATCIGCGMGPLDRIKFPFIVIDEAAQVIEPAVILPLGKGAVQAVLVGDQCQLPATVLSQEAQKGGLDISMFDRLLSMGMEMQFLSEQYRMHPQIASFPSWRFYRGELKSAVKESERQLPRGLVLSSHVALLHVEAPASGGAVLGASAGEAGHLWVGYDISPSMLKIARSREVDGDLFLADAGQSLSFRPGTFDGAVSISALQWLCNVDKKGHEPFKRLRRFFDLLYSCLRKGARAALQFYPETAAQVEMITAAALRCGFGGGLVVDYPHSAKAKKHFLVIYAGLSGEQPANMPQPMEEDEEEQVAVSTRQREVKKKNKKGKAAQSYRDKVITKKEHQRKKSAGVRKDTKYTARPRKPRAF